MDIDKILKEYEEILFEKSNRKTFDTTTKWAKQVTRDAGVYAFFDQDNVVYIGESGSLKARMGDVRRTVNHTLRRNIGAKLFSEIEGYKKATSKMKFPEHIEILVDEYMKKLHTAIVPVPFGRTEVEEYLVRKFKPKFNLKTKRGSA
ncbi:MAG: GIY-YIG nuclease family protein [Candidatus Thiodiazotropha sp.]